jgi:hypothetical protein
MGPPPLSYSPELGFALGVGFAAGALVGYMLNKRPRPVKPVHDDDEEESEDEDELPPQGEG